MFFQGCCWSSLPTEKRGRVRHTHTEEKAEQRKGAEQKMQKDSVLSPRNADAIFLEKNPSACYIWLLYCEKHPSGCCAVQKGCRNASFSWQ